MTLKLLIFLLWLMIKILLICDCFFINYENFIYVLFLICWVTYISIENLQSPQESATPADFISKYLISSNATINIVLNQNNPGFDLSRNLILFSFAFRYFPSSMEQKNMGFSCKNLHENPIQIEIITLPNDSWSYLKVYLFSYVVYS